MEFLKNLSLDLAGDAVGWSIVPHMERLWGSIPAQGTHILRLQVQSLVRVSSGNSRLIFISHIDVPPLLLSQINKPVLR